jgi:hypothetical protein
LSFSLSAAPGAVDRSPFSHCIFTLSDISQRKKVVPDHECRDLTSPDDKDSHDHPQIDPRVPGKHNYNIYKNRSGIAWSMKSTKVTPFILRVILEGQEKSQETPRPQVGKESNSDGKQGSGPGIDLLEN